MEQTKINFRINNFYNRLHLKKIIKDHIKPENVEIKDNLAIIKIENQMLVVSCSCVKNKTDYTFAKVMSLLVETEKTNGMSIMYGTIKNKDRGFCYILHELVDGNVKDLLKSCKNDIEIVESVLLQCYFALISFHGYTQHLFVDTQLENFMYHKINPEGHFHYSYKNNSNNSNNSEQTEPINIYIPNCGYLVVLTTPKNTVPIYLEDTVLSVWKDFETLFKSYSEIIKLKAFELIGVNAILNKIRKNAVLEYILNEKDSGLFSYIKFELTGSFVLNESVYILN